MNTLSLQPTSLWRCNLLASSPLFSLYSLADHPVTKYAIGTSAISRVEVGAALARAARGNRLDAEGARGAQEQFAEDWPDLGKVPVTDTLLTRAERLAWKHGLRAYDAVQLAAALVCEETITKLNESVLFGCFDDELTAAANDEGLRTWPD